MTLPRKFGVALQLTWISRRLAFLADRSQTLLDSYLITLLFESVEREVEVLAIESEPLLGMTFLEGYEVCLQVIENGSVRPEAI
ncbi:MAG: hypothetical protein H7308_04315 [Chthonomonadaceae bacterium]|nr:hypothetical protein [Chthonomonadaceae bacterium]